MNEVAKLVIIDSDDNYLLLHRNAHRTFGNDPDLPGGTLEYGERPVDTMIREVYEETGIVIREFEVRQIYEGDDYSVDKTHYVLYYFNATSRPEVNLSAEHSIYEWTSRDKFLKQAKGAKDSYMHMVYGEIKPVNFS